MAKNKTGKTVEALKHNEATRKNIPTAEYQSVMRREEQHPIRLAYERRNRDLDPQLVWRGKDEQNWSDPGSPAGASLMVQAPPLYIQEKIHPKVLIDDLRKQTEAGKSRQVGYQPDLFADFNGLPGEAAKTEFYQHEANWSNRMILGDSLQVMASLAEREGLRGKVQCIYIDPPYGIKFNSNFQWSTTSRDVKDGKAEHITREPEQVKAFRDTWRDGIHSYLTYLRDRLTVARDLLTDSGSIFVQIGDENVHRARALLDEVFGEDGHVAMIAFTKGATGLSASGRMPARLDYILWYCRNSGGTKYRQLYTLKKLDEDGNFSWVILPNGERLRQSQFGNSLPEGARLGQDVSLTKPGPGAKYEVKFMGRLFNSGKRWWGTTKEQLERALKTSRIIVIGNSLRHLRYLDESSLTAIGNLWEGFLGQTAPVYVVQTNTDIVQRCLLMTTDPGDLVLDPTCGSGTTAYVAEQWGRRWITIDTSRVALALARARLMGARYPYYILADSKAGQLKEAELSGKVPSDAPTYGNIRQGFVYQRVPHITLKAIANNAEIDVIYEKWQPRVQEALADLNAALRGHKTPFKVTTGGRAGKKVQFDAPDDARFTMPSGEEVKAYELVEWEVPRDIPDDWPQSAQKPHRAFWQARIARQKEIDASIAAKADTEYLYDKPYVDNKKVRVAGPFTVESLSPHRVLAVDEDDELIDQVAEGKNEYGETIDFVNIILENLKTAGVQQAHKEDKINFNSITPWPGHYICAEGRYVVGNKESGPEKRAAIFIGPEFGTVSRPDLVAAAREAGDAGFDTLIACAFNYDAHSSEFEKLGRIPVLKARMNADLHMADELKNTGKGNLFVIFGEPDVEVVSEEWLVDSSGRRVAPYEVFKLISGIESLAEINRLDSADLRSYAALSSRGEIWHRLANEAGGSLDSGQHRGGPGTQDDRGISALSRHCEGFAGGIGNIPDFIRTLGFADHAAFRGFVEQLRRGEQNAQWAAQITLHSPLSTRHFTQVTVNGVDVFHPQTGEVRSDGPEGIACWFIDTDYNEESFFVRQAYFLGAGDPYKSLKTTLKAEINEEVWATLYSNVSRPFEKPESGRIAVKVINHLGDEVMKVFKVKQCTSALPTPLPTAWPN